MTSTLLLLLTSLLLGALAGLFIGHRWHTRRQRQEKPEPAQRFEARENLCSPSELACLNALDRAIGPAYRVFAKVRLADVVNMPALPAATQHLVLQRHIDFLICNRDTTRPVLAIQVAGSNAELAPAAQARKERRQREDVLVTALASAGVSLMFLPAAQDFDPSELRESISQHLAGSAFIVNR